MPRSGAPRLSIVGSSASIPRPERASSCYLVDNGSTAIALDFGHGAFANLRRYIEYTALDAVVISHMHADHFLDLVALRYGLRYGKNSVGKRIALYLPPDGLRSLERIAAVLSEQEDAFLADVFDLHEYDPDLPLQLDGARLTFAPTRHFIPAFAMRYESNGVALTYSADTAPDDRVVALARRSDLFLCEATLMPGETEHGVRGHCSPAEAAAMAREAEVKHLVLTHYMSGVSQAELVASASTAFGSSISIADDHDVIEIGDLTPPVTHN